MAGMRSVDARGLSCPQPALLAREAIVAAGSGSIEVLVDSGTSRDNVARLAERSGWSVSVESHPGGVFRLVLEK